MKTINLEAGMPTVDVARRKLLQALLTSKSKREKSLKIIHGYGSSGKGGAIKVDTLSQLQSKLRSGTIKGFVKGEDFTPFSESARNILDKAPELSRDSDYNRGNEGITIVLL